MKILFITAHKYLPQVYGGLQTATHQLCLSFLERGHEVAVLARLMPGGSFALKSRMKMKMNEKILRHKVSRQMSFGYPVWYSWIPSGEIEYIAAKEKPDLIVVLAVESVRMALAARPANIPVLMMLQDVEFKKHGGSFEDLGAVPCIANSHFTAEKYRHTYGVNPTVIYPFVSAENYRTKTTKENVTFINPVPVKGRDIAAEIARLCPDIPFSFIEGWPMPPEQRRELTQKLSTLPNVALLAPQKDMRKIYGKCKILLVPSTWDEAYG
ncbi:MAG: glycosyltransferase, partial [Candidatus Acidiferrales bacterium]